MLGYLGSTHCEVLEDNNISTFPLKEYQAHKQNVQLKRDACLKQGHLSQKSVVNSNKRSVT